MDSFDGDTQNSLRPPHLFRDLHPAFITFANIFPGQKFLDLFGNSAAA